ncbi:SUF system Fe-S cluster assembly regulator [Kordiimonas pumila]|uniref:SUF system Fe-S cluster assembly regulator n=1 Tax=Kordiimonas pumila TaxID=2161677 RepID=A0ABV7D672_9PROT|nr:SUF system Fe-S cluster assembly regulator [Kordiimonas pumila]
MLRLTKLADYGVILMCEMSHSVTRLNAQDLAGSTGIPLPTVSKILNLLSRSHLLQSHRGLKGGFSLARSADDISVAEIIEAIDGPIALTLCSEGTSCDCGFDEICSLRPRWQVINSAVKGALHDVSLTKIAEPAFGGHVMQQLAIPKGVQPA